MRKTETYQETSKLGPFAWVALGIHGAAVLLGSLGTPPDKPADTNENPAYEILVAWEAPEEPKVAVSEVDAPSFASGTTDSAAFVPALQVADTAAPDAEGSAQEAFKESPADSSMQPDSLDDLALAIDVLRSTAEGAATGAVATRGSAAGRGLFGKAGSGRAAASSGKGRLAHHKATLVAQSPCTDLFPYGARIASATIAVKVDVDPSGKARLSRVLSELPQAGGFGAATTACSARLRFEPARDASGAAITSQAVVRLHFERNG